MNHINSLAFFINQVERFAPVRWHRARWPERGQTMGERAEALRAVIADAVPAARRGTVWNAPNFAIGGQDMITLNLSPKGPVRVIFHIGATALDPKTGM